MTHTINNSAYDWSWVLSNVNCITRRMISLIKISTAKISQWILGKGKAFTDQIVAPPRVLRFTLNNGSLT